MSTAMRTPSKVQMLRTPESDGADKGAAPQGHLARAVTLHLAGKREEEFGAFAGFRLDPHTAPVALHDLVTDRQTYSASCILRASVQAFKKPKDLLVILLIDPNPVVRDAKLPHLVILLRGNMDPRGSFAPVLETIPDEILQKLLDMNFIDAKHRQRVACNPAAAFCNCGIEHVQDLG